MYFARRTLIPMLLIGILLSSCGGQLAAGQPTPDVNATVAVAAQTMAASIFQTLTAAAPTITNTAPPTVTSLPTSTALLLPTAVIPSATQQTILYYPSVTPTGTYYTATPLASSLAVGCNNLRLINSYTEPDGPFQPGDDFTQAWQVENNGTCDWLYLYEVVYVSGDKLGEATAVRFSNKIEPGKWTTIRVNMHAPKGGGTYSATWRFTDGAGKAFGSTLPISIKVVSPTKTPKPTPTSTPTPTDTSAP